MELACSEEAGKQLQQEEVFQQRTEMTISQNREEIQERIEVLHQQQERMEVLYHQQQQEMKVLHQQQKERIEIRTSYNFFSKYLHFPSHVTLKKQLQNIPIDTGCNKSILQYLCLIKKEIDPKDLYVVLIYDEMSVQPAVQYDPKNDKIIGLEDWGTKQTRKIADHAIVFYIRCLASGKHMPIGYGYSHSATNSIQLARCIKEWLLALIKCGFKPVASVCDQGGTNIAPINLLIQQTRPALHGNSE
ncbi:uncharacterized protein LOC143899338 [Temnothorax americanus]|uniref:uncharacterized protein LOC143899338 n=1 Tax=Temnothorax americanus TaxID=1964332 RepID=UPI0040675EAF